MSWYIEQENTSSIESSVSTSEEEEEKLEAERWKWLISGWDKMSFLEKMSVFLPKVHYIDLRNSKRQDFDESINTDIVKMSYEYCRDYSSLKFDPDREATPNLLIIYEPINTNNIPDSDVKAKVIAWGKKYHFL